MTRKKILIIEDDQNLNYILKLYLERNGYTALSVTTGKEGLENAKSNKFNLCIVDIGLPDIDGISLVKRLRNEYNNKPIIIITDKYTEQNEIDSYFSGGNIFHEKPIRFDLLNAQLISLLNSAQGSKKYGYGDLFIDMESRVVSKKNKNIELTKKEFDLLSMLIAKPEKVFNRNEIIGMVLRNQFEISEAAVDTLVWRLRRKLGRYKGNEYIETAFKIGYRINKEINNLSEILD